GQILVRYLDEDIAILDRYLGGLRRDHRRQAGHLAGADVEARAVPRTLDRHLPELALAKRVLLVRAGVADGIEVVVFRVHQADRLAVDLHTHHRLLGKLTRRCDSLASHASQCAQTTPGRRRRAPGRPAVDPGPRPGTPGPASAPQSAAECRDSPGRTDAPGPPGRPLRRGCSARCRC